MHTDRYRIIVLATVFCALVLLGTVGMMALESRGLVDALYFSLSTVTTMGYGDTAPATQPGKLLAVVLILSGGGMFFGLVATILEHFFRRKDTERRREKTRMLSGVFFSGLGNELLRLLATMAASRDMGPDAGLLARLDAIKDWDDAEFARMRDTAQACCVKLSASAPQLERLHGLLSGNRELLLRLLEHPSVMEHERFTDLLRAVFHLAEELAARPDFTNRPDSDLAHLAGDCERIFRVLLAQWAAYLLYIKSDYPYLFSLAVRTNPFAHGSGDGTVL